MSNKYIAIVTPDFLQGYGLKMLLEEYYSLDECDILLSVTELENKISKYDIIFSNDNLYYLNHSRLSPFKNKLILITEKADVKTSDIPALLVTQQQEEILQGLHLVLKEKNQKSKEIDNKTDLSEREKEVLALIAKGEQNKAIADKLFISLNTVLTHRKNITAKLGIKTVSGLTVYAILNGLITTNDISSLS